MFNQVSNSCRSAGGGFTRAGGSRDLRDLQRQFWSRSIARGWIADLTVFFGRDARAARADRDFEIDVLKEITRNKCRRTRAPALAVMRELKAPPVFLDTD